MGACTNGDLGTPVSIGDGDEGDGRAPGRLTARVEAPRPATPSYGLRRLPLSGGEGFIYVPDSYRKNRPAPLVLMLHGASSSARQGIGPFFNLGDHGVILVAPKSHGQTWDLMLGGFGRDLRFIDRVLGYAFERYTIDQERVGVLGFSDGASYALSIGITNGDLFRHVMALSPGYVAAGAPRGRPRLFVAHGQPDKVPFEAASGPIVRRLRSEGYDVTHVQHAAGHTPRPMAPRAMRWFLRGRH